MILKLFLCSYLAGTSALLPRFMGADLKDKSVAFIPTASLNEAYKDHVEEGRQALQALGLKVEELEVTTKTKTEIAEILNRTDLICVMGGNTFFLLQELKRSGADVLIRQQIEKGKPYIGESAGSIIVAPNIEYIRLMDDTTAAPQLKTYDALDIVDFYPLPHYQSEPFEAAADEIIKQYSHLDLHPFTNAQVLIIDGNSVKLEHVEK